MKKTIILLLTSVTFLITCSKVETRKAYYNFRDNDIEKLLTFEINQIIKYKNEVGDEIIFNTEIVTDDYKHQLRIGSWIIPGTADYFYYDKQEIELITYPNIPIRYSFWRYPDDVEQAKEDYFTEYPSKFHHRVTFYYWNGLNGYSDIPIDFDSETIYMSFNDKNYENVYVIESENPNPIESRNVNKIFYDLHNGIIGFDDLDGKHWRISN